MLDGDHALPGLDFDDVFISFPERGNRAFLPERTPFTVEPGDPPAQEPGTWLLRTGSGLSVLVPDRATVTRNGSDVLTLAVLHHGEEIRFAARAARFREVRQAVLAPGDSLLERRCPCCHAPLEIGAVVACCPLCQHAYHVDCWNHLADVQCYSQNCRFAPDSLSDMDVRHE